MASYYFPPDAAVGGLRLAKFARFLPEFGWDPLVLTVRDEYRTQGFDDRRSEGLEAVPIVRTHELPRVWSRVGTIWRELRARRQRRSDESADLQSAPTASADPREHAETAIERVKRWIISLGVLLPDDKKHWAGRAAFTAIWLVKRGNIEYVLTSGPPFSTHFIGLTAKAFAGASWIADFRDPWVDMLPERFGHTRSRLSDFIEHWLEALVVRVADHVVVTTPHMLAAFRARYPSLDGSRIVCIPNGIDSGIFHASDERRDGPLTITYTGSLYFDRTPEPLFQAVHELLATGRITGRDIRIQLVGNCRTIEGIETQTIAHRYGLDGIVDILDPIPHADAIRLMQRSHLLLVLAPERHRLVVPAKIYDYLGSGSTVLAIAEQGATADLMRETRCGRWFSARDVAGLRDYLGGLIANGTFRSLRNDPASFSAYDVRHLTARLAATLDGKQMKANHEVAVQG